MENGREKRAEEITEEITADGLAYLLLTDWTVKFCILFPVILGGLSLGDAVRSIVAGVVLWCIVIGIVQRWSKPGREFLSDVEARVGRKMAVAVCAVSLWYFLAHTAVFARLWASLFRTYLASGIPAAVLCAVPLAAGLALCGRDLRFRARVSRFVGTGLLVLFAVFVFLIGNEVPDGAFGGALTGSVAQTGGLWLADLAGLPWVNRAVAGMDGFLRSAYEVFVSMGGMFLPFLFCRTVSGRRGEKTPAGTARMVGCVCAAVAAAFCVAAGLLLTSQERRLADFPAVEAVRRLRPFGMDVGNCGIVLVFLLLAGLTMTVAGGIWHVQRSWEYLCTACVEFSQGQLLRDIRKRMARGLGRQGTPQEEQELYETEFSGELSALPGQSRVRYYGVRMTRKLSGLPYAKKVSCYGERISESLTGRRLWWWTVLLTVYVLAAGFADAFSALMFYRAYNMQILVPVMAGFYLVTKVAVSRKKML